MKLVVGLGNPGDKYQATRHNAGFWLVERLAARSGTVLRKDGKFQALVGRHEASGAWLMLPQSYMNSSGRPVQMLASFFRIVPADILVIHDELDLPPGTAKLKQGGGIAGHNGLKDISARLGSHEYWRLRLGVGRPADGQAGSDFVLHRPAQEERTAIDAAIERSLEVMPLVLAGDLQGAMLKLHTQEQEEASARPKRVDRVATPERVDKPLPERVVRANEPQSGQKVENLVKTEAARNAPLPANHRSLPVPPAPPVSGIATPDPAGPVEKTSSIEKFGSAAQAGQFHKTGNRDQAEERDQAESLEGAERSHEVEESAKAERKGTLNSLFRKFLPGSDPARKK